mmetsp:Transcript_4766/g.11064  ORF Transcript_4766/g.11064 Transcript_4766/m.11064 type:complete len:220 (+) Transcript_4766:84-743(+)
MAARARAGIWVEQCLGRRSFDDTPGGALLANLGLPDRRGDVVRSWRPKHSELPKQRVALSRARSPNEDGRSGRVQHSGNCGSRGDRVRRLGKRDEKEEGKVQATICRTHSQGGRVESPGQRRPVRRRTDNRVQVRRHERRRFHREGRAEGILVKWQDRSRRQGFRRAVCFDGSQGTRQGELLGLLRLPWKLRRWRLGHGGKRRGASECDCETTVSEAGG